MSKEKVVDSKDITIKIGLDANKMPVHMEWETEGNPQESKAMLLSLFDKEHKDTFKIDLWTNEMQVNEMDRFFYQTLRGLADTYFNATKNHKLASDMRKFVDYFGEQTEVIPKE